jgi:hypothetical protein
MFLYLYYTHTRTQVRDMNDNRGVGEALLRVGDGNHALCHMNMIGKHNIEQYDTVTVRPATPDTATMMTMPSTPISSVKKQTIVMKMGDLFGIGSGKVRNAGGGDIGFVCL